MWAVTLLLLMSLWEGQTPTDPFVDFENVPWPVRLCLNADRAHYRVDRRMNPFYLRGDFNGDSHPDYAVLVEETASGKKGIAVCFGGLPSELHVLAAGTPFAMEGNRKVDDFGQFFDVWSVVEKGKLSPRGEGIYLQRAEAGGGLILWDGHRFLWEQWGI